MDDTPGFFTDGEAYERLMGAWSRAAGAVFLDWLALPQGLRWLDVGCGTGAFTALLRDRCAPASVAAIDPSAEQIAYAKSRPGAAEVDFRVGPAEALPFPDGAFDAAAMALVVSFLSDAAKAVGEMKRVVRPGGTVATYIWDMTGGGFPQEPLRAAIEQMGISVAMTGVESSRRDRLRTLFAEAGLEAVEDRVIEVTQTYAGFDDFWDANTALANPIVQPIRAMSEAEVDRLKAALRARLPTDAAGRITCTARANAVKGRVPG